MIICVTPNVAVDRTYIVPTVKLGTVLRSKQTLVTAGGKGLNVARAVTVLGERALVLGILGGRSGDLVVDLTAKEELPARWTWSAAETRNCAILAGEDGSPTTVINDRGGQLSVAEWLQFVHDVAEAVAGKLPPAMETEGHGERGTQTGETVSAVCICGSLPPGAPTHAPSDLVEAVLATGTPVWVDTGGAALVRALEAKPTGIKINDEEAGGLLGRTLTYLDDVYDAAHAIRRMGAEHVIITLGTRGAVLVGPGGELHLRAPVVHAVSTMGSGDAFLGGWLVAQARKKSTQVALQWATAAGAANALIPGGGLFARADFEELLAQV